MPVQLMDFHLSSILTNSNWFGISLKTSISFKRFVSLQFILTFFNNFGHFCQSW
jgi:hypothetical protein